MIAKIIIDKQLNGYTAKSIPLAIDGKRVKQAKFTKTVGMLSFCSSRLFVF